MKSLSKLKIINHKSVRLERMRGEDFMKKMVRKVLFIFAMGLAVFCILFFRKQTKTEIAADALKTYMIPDNLENASIGGFGSGVDNLGPGLLKSEEPEFATDTRIYYPLSNDAIEDGESRVLIDENKPDLSPIPVQECLLPKVEEPLSPEGKKIYKSLAMEHLEEEFIWHLENVINLYDKGDPIVVSNTNRDKLVESRDKILKKKKSFFRLFVGVSEKDLREYVKILQDANINAAYFLNEVSRHMDNLHNAQLARKLRSDKYALLDTEYTKRLCKYFLMEVDDAYNGLVGPF